MAERRRKRASDPLEELGLNGFAPGEIPVPHVAPIEPEAEEAEVEFVETLPAIPATGRRRRLTSAATANGSVVAANAGAKSNSAAPQERAAEESGKAERAEAPASPEVVEETAAASAADAASVDERDADPLAQTWAQAMQAASEEAPQHEAEVMPQPAQVVVACAFEAWMTDAPVLPLEVSGVSDENDPLHAPLSAFQSIRRGQLGVIRTDLIPERAGGHLIGQWRHQFRETCEEPERGGRPSRFGGVGAQRAGVKLGFALGRGLGVFILALVKLIGLVLKGLFSAIFHESRVAGTGGSAKKTKAAAPPDEEPKILSERDKGRIKVAGNRLNDGPYFQARIRVVLAQVTEPEDVEHVGEILEAKALDACRAYSKLANHDQHVNQELDWSPCDPLEALIGITADPKQENDMLLGLSEAAALAHPPSYDPPNISMDRSNVRQVMPAVMPETATDPLAPPKGLIPFGRLNDPHHGPLVGIQNNVLNEHLFVGGATGTGKSEVASWLMLGMVREGYPLFLLDPHGELAWKTLMMIAAYCPERLDDIVYLDPTDEWAPSINPLDVRSAEDIEAAADRLMKMMGRQNFTAETHTRAYPLAEQVIRALCWANLEIEDEHNKLTIAHIDEFLTDSKFRQTVMTFCPDRQVRKNFNEEDTGRYDKLKEAEQAEHSATIARVLNQILRSPQFSRMFLTNDRLDFVRLINENKIVLISNKRGAGSQAKKIGEMVSAMLLPQLLSSMAMLRKGCRVVIDEAPAILPVLDDLEALLAEARKYDAGMTVLAQFPGQMGEMVEPLRQNAKSKLLLQMAEGPGQANFHKAVSSESVAIGPGDLNSLPNFVGYANILVRGKRRGAEQVGKSGPFTLHTLPPLPLDEEKLKPRIERIIDNTRREIGANPRIVEARLKGNRLMEGPVMALGDALKRNAEAVAAGLADPLNEGAKNIWGEVPRELVDTEGHPVVDAGPQEPDDADLDWLEQWSRPS